MSDANLDNLLGANLSSAQPLRTFVCGQAFRRDGIHREFSKTALNALCPSSATIIQNISKSVYPNSPIVFGRQVYVSVLKPTDLRNYKWSGTRRCGLLDCNNFISKDCAYGYAAIVMPETHIFCDYPFLPISNFPSSKGLFVCGIHCKISSDPALAPTLEPLIKVLMFFL